MLKVQVSKFWLALWKLVVAAWMSENYELVPSNKFAYFISGLNHIAHCGHLKLTSLVELVNPKIHLVQEDGEEKQSCNLLAVQSIVQYGCRSSGICLWYQINHKHQYVTWTLASKWDTSISWLIQVELCSFHLMLSWLIHFLIAVTICNIHQSPAFTFVLMWKWRLQFISFLLKVKAFSVSSRILRWQPSLL